MGRRVFWTQSEVDEVFKLVPSPVPLPWWTMWKKAQRVLSPERRKTLRLSSSSTQLKHQYEEWRTAHPEFRPPEKLVLPEDHLTDKLEAKPAPEPSHCEPEIIVVERPVRVEPEYGAIPTSTLARILLERLALMDQFDARFRDMEAMIKAKNLAEQNHDLRLGPAPPPVQPKEEKVRIAIVGPLGSQFSEIENRCANTCRPVKLRCYDKDAKGQNPDGIVDYAIVTKHCNHAWWDKMRAALPSDRVFFVDGGIQAVVQRIYDITARRDV